MITTLEKIARVLQPGAWAVLDNAWPDKRGVAKRKRQKSLLGARAVLDAMREPTQGVEAAGAEVTIPVGWENVDIGPYGAEKAWRAMIDAAKDGQ